MTTTILPYTGPGAQTIQTADDVVTKLEALRLLLVALGGYEDGVEGFVDGLEALMGINNVALGAPGDTAWTTGNGSTIALLKAVAGLTAATNTAIAATNTLLGDTTTPAPITATALPLPTGAATAAAQATLNASVSAAGTTATTAQGVQGVTGGLPIDTVFKSTATSRSVIVGFVGTAAAATTASTTLTVTVTTGVPTVGQTVSGTGITAGTTITAVTGTAPYSLTLSAAATVASGAAVTSVGMQVLMVANTARRGFVIQNQHATAKFWINGVGNAAADASSLLINANSYYDTSAVHTGTGAISVIGDTPGIMLYAREF